MRDWWSGGKSKKGFLLGRILRAGVCRVRVWKRVWSCKAGPLARPSWSRREDCWRPILIGVGIGSRDLCRVWGRCSLIGQIKDMTAQASLLKLEERGWVALPARSLKPPKNLHLAAADLGLGVPKPIPPSAENSEQPPQPTGPQ